MRFVLVAVLLAACSGDAKYAVEKLQDPNTCKECHPKHFDQWSGSMHAYASEDPIFVALNKRGQRDTNGALGDFCVKCHAPMGLELGLSAASGPSYDPNALPPEAKGVTCYFCHNVESVKDDHNNGLVIAMDQTMRGGVKDPATSPAHHSKYDTLMASKTNNSTMCGSCHDVVTPAGVALERSFAEWKETVFAINDPTKFLPQTCSGCHMFATTEVIADNPKLNVGVRKYGFHEHAFPAVDQALTPFPNMEEQARLVQRDLDPALKIVGLRPLGSQQPYGGICLEPNGQLTVRVDTFNVGHLFPSGVAHDRRTWIELIAYNASNNIVFQSGVVPDGVDPEDINDPYVNCTLPGTQSCSGFWERAFKADGSKALFFWDVATSDSKLLKAQITLDQNSSAYDHSTTVRYTVGSVANQIDHVTARIRMRPVPYALVDELIASGDLDPAIRAQIKTLDIKGSMSTWTRATAGTGLAINTFCNPN